MADSRGACGRARHHHEKRLWYEMSGVIGRPVRLCGGEKRAGKRQSRPDQVKDRLEQEGYAVYPSVVAARPSGAPQEGAAFCAAVRKDKADSFRNWTRLQEKRAWRRRERVDDRERDARPSIWRLVGTPDADADVAQFQDGFR